DAGSGVATFGLMVDGQALSGSLTPTLPPAAASVTATASFNTTTVADGAHTLGASATDAAGNTGSTSRVVIVDNTPPDTQITDGPNGEIHGANTTFTFTGTDNLTPTSSLRFAWRLDGGTYTAFSETTTVNLTGLAEGAHTFEVKARDLAGNEDATLASRAFTVALPPTITSVTPTSGPIGTFVTIVGSGFTPGPTQVTFNGVPAIVRSFTSTQVTTTVALDARTGPIVVTTPRGFAVSSQPFTVMNTQDFALAATPPAGQVLQGTSTTYTLDLQSAGGTTFTGLATLAVNGLPPGVTAAFGAPALSGGQRGTLTLTAAPTATTGTAALTVSATAPTDLGPVTRTAAVSVNVQAGGRTALTGQITFVNGAPINGVQLALGALTAVTDAGGNFRLLDPPSGTQMLGIDANAAQPGLPIYAID